MIPSLTRAGLRIVGTVMPFIVAAVVLTGAAEPAWAYKRLVERNGYLARTAWGVLGGVGTYGPRSSPSAATTMLTGGLRYIWQEFDDYIFHSLGAELTANTWSSSTEDVFIVDGGVLTFYPRTQVFAFDHHFFYGAGIGQATVTRPRQNDLRLPIGYITAGVQGRIRDWYLEARLKLVLGQRRSAFDVTGAAPLLVACYHFNP